MSEVASQALRRSIERAELAGVIVDLRSRPGTIAQQVLALVGLPTTSRWTATGTAPCT